MKPLSASALILCLLCGAAGAAPATNFASRPKSAVVQIAPPLKAHRVGEKLVYEVFWMGVFIGTGTLEVKEERMVRGRRALVIEAVAETNEFLSKIYPVRDTVRTVIDAERSCSLEFSKTVSEGRYRADESMIYDHERKTIFYESKKNGSKKEYPLIGCVQDFLSAFYWYRLQPVEVGKSVRTVVNDEENNWDLEIRCLEARTEELRGGKVLNVFVVEPKTKLKGILYDRGRAWVHFDAGSERVPVRFVISTPFGPVTAALKTVKVLSRIA